MCTYCFYLIPDDDTTRENERPASADPDFKFRENGCPVLDLYLKPLESCKNNVSPQQKTTDPTSTSQHPGHTQA